MVRAGIFGPTQFMPGCGEWSRKYWKNIPGPFYSTTHNMMELLASINDPSHLLYDTECEFVWRQPATKEEYDACMGAINYDCCASYQRDGNQQWTPSLVREWWSRHDELLIWAESLLQCPHDNPERFHSGYDDCTDRKLIQEYVRFLQQDAEEYLRSYIFLLETGKPAGMYDALPSL